MKDTLTTIHERTSTNIYETERSIDEQQIRELIRDATEAPSSYNMQNWRFIAVTDSEKKQKLKAVAYGQEKVATASVTSSY